MIFRNAGSKGLHHHFAQKLLLFLKAAYRNEFDLFQDEQSKEIKLTS
jgi:hypothetical protein